MTDFIRIPSNPVPEGGEIFNFSAPDGATLRAALFPVEHQRGSVVLMNGRCEFLEKYFEVIDDLRKRRLSVAIMDWRGQGLSERALPVSEKGHIDSFETYKSDLRHFTETIVKPRFEGPRILMTHSMGGLPALMLLNDNDDAFDCAVLCAPMTKFHMPPSMEVYTRTVSGAAAAFGFSKSSVFGVKEHSLEFEGNILTSDPRRHERFRQLQLESPNACLLAPTYGWINAAMKAIDAIHKPGALNHSKIPILIISAEHDDLVSTADHRALAAAYDNIDQIEIKGALHEILMERDEFRDQYWKAFDAFTAPVLNAAE